MVEEQEISQQLFVSKSSLRRAAAKYIGKNKIENLGDKLWDAYLNEAENPKTWETQVEMIKSLGLIRYAKAKQPLYSICKSNKKHDMITSSATKAYVRIARENLQDIIPVLDLLSFGDFEVVSSAFEVLGEDKMVPSEKEILFLLNYISKSNLVKEKGYTDFRIGFVCACAGFSDIPEVKLFLTKCLDNEDSFFAKVAINSLNRKYTAIS